MLFSKAQINIHFRENKEINGGNSSWFRLHFKVLKGIGLRPNKGPETSSAYDSKR